MTTRLWAGVVALAAACAWLPEPGDPLDPAVAREPGIGLPILSFLWKREIHDRAWDQKPQEFAAAAVYKETLFVGSQGGTFYALDAANGGVKWKHAIGASSARPLVWRGSIFLGTDDGSLVAMNTYDGSVRWRFATKGAILHEPVIVGDRTLVFSNDADHVYALDVDTGKWKWQYERETPEEFTVRGHAGVILVGDRLYTGFADGHVVALSAESGEVEWVRSLAGEKKEFVDVDTTPVVESGVLYASSTSGGVYALDAEDGTERWRLAVDSAGPVTVDGDHVYFAAADEGLHALDAHGHVLWRQGLRRGGDPARPVIVGDYLFLSLSETGLYVVDKRRGALLQQFDPGPGVSSEPTIVGDRLYVLSNGGILYAMSMTEFAAR